MKIGLLVPHFGEHAARETLLAGCRLAEDGGFDSVWVRDHVVFAPHGEFESADRTFLESLTTLSVIGAQTNRISLGTGALIPTRHPLHVAQVAATLTHLVGPRLTLGLGTGNDGHEFSNVGLGNADRTELTLENLDVLRRAWSGEPFSAHGGNFPIIDAVQLPTPAGPIPLWWCGNTPRSARLAAEFCEGWMPGRIGLATLKQRVRAIEELAAMHRRPRPTIAIIPSVSVAPTHEAALRDINVVGLLAWANNARYWVKPQSGRFETLTDLRGVLLAGTAADIVCEIERLANVGVDHVVMDCRMTFHRWQAQLELLAAEVVPAAHNLTTSRPSEAE